MKKIIIAGLLFVFGAMVFVGCTQKSTEQPPVSPDKVADSAGLIIYQTFAIKDYILSMSGISVQSSSVKAKANTDPVYTGGWWFVSVDQTITITNETNPALAVNMHATGDLYFKVWNTDNDEVVTSLQGLTAQNIKEVNAYATLQFDSNTALGDFEEIIGQSKAKPLIYNPPNISGTITITNKNTSPHFSIAFDVSGVTLVTVGDSILPTGGLVGNIIQGGSNIGAVGLAFNGSEFATLTITLNGVNYKYSVNLKNGVAIPI